jgi:energy-coupling factor transporter transmembrane protein EcfT
MTFNKENGFTGLLIAGSVFLLAIILDKIIFKNITITIKLILIFLVYLIFWFLITGIEREKNKEDADLNKFKEYSDLK